MPKAATISAPPSERKKFMLAVAVPSWWRGTAFWIVMVESGRMVPSPRLISRNSTSSAASGSAPALNARTAQQATLTPMATMRHAACSA